MSQFSGSKIHALQQLAVGDDAAADAGAQSHQQKGIACVTTGFVFTPGSAVGIVAHSHGHIQNCLQRPNQRTTGETQMVRIFHTAGLGVGGAGHAHAHTENICLVKAVFLHQTAAKGGDIGDDLLQSGGQAGFDVGTVDDAAVFIHQSCGGVGAAKVDSDSVHK